MRRSILAVAVCASLLLACGDDGTGGGNTEFVTIAGIVRDVDSLEPAVGVRVRLLDTAYADEVATGTDGAYELKVPKNSKLMLVTDDFKSTDDVWYPMINVDYPPVVATTDLLDWPIHACYQTIGRDEGSLAVYDHYLKTQDDANGDIFVPTGVAEASGVVVISFFGCTSGSIDPGPYTFHVTTNETAFPIGYFELCILTPPAWQISCNPIMYPPTRTVADKDGGLAITYGDPAFTGKFVAFSIEDSLSTRHLAWAASVKLPVRKGALTLVIPSFVDGVPNRPFPELSTACKLFGGP